MDYYLNLIAFVILQFLIIRLVYMFAEHIGWSRGFDRGSDINCNIARDVGEVWKSEFIKIVEEKKNLQQRIEQLTRKES